MIMSSKPNGAGFLAIFISFGLAMILRILPLPDQFFVFNPDWVLLFLIYWNLAIPERIAEGSAWFIGLLTDVLTGRVLGQHAMAYAVIAYLCIKSHRRMRFYPVSQQALSVLLFLLLSQLLIFWTTKGSNTYDAKYWLPSVTGALLWPLVFVALRQVRRHYQIN